jgi:hypothetical protein
MVKVIVGKDCGNSPKNLFLRDFNIAVAKGNAEVIDQSITEDVTWHLFEPANQKTIHGRDGVLEEYVQNLVIVPAEYNNDTVITHGDRGAVSGTIKATDGKSYVFCDIYIFSSHAKGAKIQEMTSYIIRVESKEENRNGKNGSGSAF